MHLVPQPSRYSALEIEALCRRLEGRAESVLVLQPSFSSDLLAAALVIRQLMTAKGIEIGIPE